MFHIKLTKHRLRKLFLFLRHRESECLRLLNSPKTGQKGPAKLIQRVKTAHSFLQPVSNQFHFIVFSLPMQFCIWLPKNFSEMEK